MKLIKSFRLESLIYAEFQKAVADDGKTVTQVFEEFMRYYLAGGRIDVPGGIDEKEITLLDNLVSSRVAKSYAALVCEINALQDRLNSLEESIQAVNTPSIDSLDEHIQHVNTLS